MKLKRPEINRDSISYGVRLRQDQIDAIRWLSNRSGITQSEILRQVLDYAFDAFRKEGAFDFDQFCPTNAE
jgi:hypothetical protein